MQWMEIFKTGTHVDARGQKREWTQADLDQMVLAYNQGDHEAPIVLGHPKENGPAYGWIAELKREGDLLLARPKQVLAKFKDWVNAGSFKKRSISLYPDLTLRHVGFLGAFPPAVKGLKDFAFGEERQSEEAAMEYFTFDFEEVPAAKTKKPKKVVQPPEALAAEEGVAVPAEVEGVEETPAEEEAEGTKNSPATEEAEGTEDNLAEPETPVSPGTQAKALKKAKVALAQQKALNQQTQANFAELAAQNQRQKDQAWVQQQIAEGRLLPAWKEMGLLEFMSALEGTSYQFNEQGEKEPLVDWFKSFIESFTAHPLFTEMNPARRPRPFGEADQAQILGQQIAGTTGALISPSNH